MYGKLKSIKSPLETKEDIDKLCEQIVKAYDYGFKVSCKVKRPSKSLLPSYFTSDLTAMRVALRNKFNISYRNGEWADYKALLSKYNKARNKAKKDSWKKFCESIESVNGTARFRKILSKAATSSEKWW